MTTKSSLGEHPALVADVGGTHIRIAIATADGLADPKTWLCSDFDSIEEALKAYLAASSPVRAPRQAAIAVACPVAGDRIELTNQRWIFSIDQLTRDLGLERLEVINDFTALAAAIPRLQETEVQLVKDGRAEPLAPIAVIGPGTGLGVSGLIHSHGRWIPLSAEGGHCTLAAASPREWAVVQVLAEEFGRVSNERVLSGPGLANLYRALVQLDGETPRDRTAAQIVDRARKDPDSQERTAVQMFSSWLGEVSGDLVLSLGARGGVYLGGGVLPKMIGVFDTDRFGERFLAKGRMRGYLEPVPVYMVTNTQIALTGAAAIIQES